MYCLVYNRILPFVYKHSSCLPASQSIKMYLALLLLITLPALIYAQDVEKFGNLTIITDRNATLNYTDSIRKCQSYGLRLISLENLQEFLHAHSLSDQSFEKFVFNEKVGNNYVLAKTMDSLKQHNAILIYMSSEYMSRVGGQILCSKVTSVDPSNPTSAVSVISIIIFILCIASWLMIIILFSIHKCVKPLPFLLLLTRGNDVSEDMAINRVRFLNIGTLDNKRTNVVDV
jgi:hypothetical protein